MPNGRSQAWRSAPPTEIDEKSLFVSSNADLLTLVENNLAPDRRDLEIASAAYLELERRGKAGRAKEIVSASDTPPILWLRDARNALSILEPPETGRYQGHLYVALLGGLTASNGFYSAYVGSSKYRPDTRFDQHLADVNASGKVRRRGIQLIRSLCWPWRTVPGGKDERLLWESALNRCLSLVVPKVDGDWVPPEDWPRGFQENLRRRLTGPAPGNADRPSRLEF